jgi:thiol-disulfide isomerase/thioredoxin
MLILTLDNDNHQELATTLSEDGWVAACLCAAWCGSCREYFANFTALAQRHPHVQFVWIDIEDQAELIGDLDVDNFPTLLIQRGDVVRLAERILLAQMEKSTPELQAEAQSSTERRHWQLEANLLRRLADI